MYWLALILSLFIPFIFFPNTEHLFGFDVHSNKLNVKLPESYIGPLLSNKLLSDADQLYFNEIRGPEAFAKFNGKVYASLADGRIIEISKSHFRTVAFLNPENRDLSECQRPAFAVKHCSRPLGIRFHSNGTLYAIDPYHGIYHVNVNNGHYHLVMDMFKHRLPNDDAIPKLLDDLVLIEENENDITFIMSDASRRWQLHDVFFIVAENDQTGRLLSFNTKTQKVSLLLDNLYFPNGLAFTDNKTILLFNEFNARRVLAYQLQGPNKGQVKVLIDNLPGGADNLKRSLNQKAETYWIGLFSGHSKHRPSLFLDLFKNLVTLKRTLLRMMRTVGFLIQSFGNLFNCACLEQFGFDIRVGNWMYPLVADYGLGIEIDVNGNIINSIHSPDAKTSILSEVFEYEQTEDKRFFYLGSLYNRFMGRLIVDKSKFNDISIDNEYLNHDQLVQVKNNQPSKIEKQKSKELKKSKSDNTLKNQNGKIEL